MNSPGAVLASSYDDRLVALSVFIAMLASYAALDLAGRVTSARGLTRAAWLSGGATAMGIGIWSMHYVGMLAFRLPVPVLYDWPTVLVSLVAAVLASAIALFVASREKMNMPLALVGSVVMGGGIAGMHYIGMAAMRLPAMCRYSSGIVAISVALAIVISLVALWLAFQFGKETTWGGWRKFLSAIVMGAGIPVMHYTGMAAARFTSSPSVEGNLSRALSVTSLGTTSIVIATFVILALASVTSWADRRLSAQALELEFSQKAESKFRGLLESAPDAMIVVTRGGEIALVNSQAERLFGYSRAELLYQRLGTLIPERFGEPRQHLINFFAAPRFRAMGTGFKFYGLRKDGNEFPAEITLGPIQTEEGLLVCGAIRDITEQKQFEQTLREAKEAAETASRAKTRFLAAMSHELRTPMNGICGMTELALDTELTDEQREYLDTVQSSAALLLSLIDDILDFSQMEASELVLEPIPFGPRSLLGDSLKGFGAKAREKGLELRFDVRPDVPESVVGDPDRIRKILFHLVGNAIKFTERGEVSVRIEEKSREGSMTSLHFTVKDTGIGIPAEVQEKIFEPFSQADGSMSRKYGGAGMGLTICSRLVTAMGGTISLESQLGRGSEFKFTLPLTLPNALSPHTKTIV